MITTARYCAVAAALALAGCAQQLQSVPGGGLQPASSIREAARSVSSASESTLEGGAVVGEPRSACRSNAVFIRLDTEIRGYPLEASGVTAPCTIIRGPKTLLNERGPLVISKHGYLHSLSFQSNGNNGLTIQPANANGDVAPTRVADVSQDHIALAVDSFITDFIVASEAYASDNCWSVVRNLQSGSNISNCDVSMSAIHALATDARDELVVAGTDAVSGEARIDVYAYAATNSSRRVRSIKGPKTGLVSLTGNAGYFNISLALATDPVSGAIYIYDRLRNDLGFGIGQAKVSQFAPDANGNVAPQRTLTAPQIGLVHASYGLDMIGVDSGGNLYVLTGETVPTVAVFGRDARGNVPPERYFSDPSAKMGAVGASIAVRSLL